MANFAKHGKGAVGHLGLHFERGLGADGERVKYNNEAIDVSRSHLNYNLGPERNMTHAQYIGQRTSEVYCFNRADVKVLGTWSVTLPKGQGLEGREREFFEKTYEFLKNRYGGEKNVVSAYVHMDETTPHMHFAFVPVVPDKKKGLKVSMKECVDRKDLLSFHQDLERELAKTFGREVGILNGATKEGNQSIAELKRHSAMDRLKEINDEKNKATNIALKVREFARESKMVVVELQKHKKTLEGQIKALEGDIGKVKGIKLDFAQIDAISGKYGLMDKKKVTLDANEFEGMKQKLKKASLLEAKVEHLERENSKMNKDINTFKSMDYQKKQIAQIQKVKALEVELGQVTKFLAKTDQAKDFEDFKKAMKAIKSKALTEEITL